MRTIRPLSLRFITTLIFLPLIAAFTHGTVNQRVSSNVGCEMLADTDYEDNNNKQVSRRDILAKALAAGLAGLTIEATSASADGALPDLALMGNPTKKKLGGLAQKIRKITVAMDELQRDLMQERWDLVETYPDQLRSFVPVLTTYTDSAYPTDIPTDKGLRVALRYEVGRFFASLERLRQAISRKSLDQAYVAYSDMALHFDRYLRVGGLYTYYDDSISNEKYFSGFDDTLVYSDPIKDPAEVRDLIVLTTGPDKGKTGIVLALYPDGSKNCVVKLDRIKGMREIRVVPRQWAAKRLGEQDPDDVFLIPRK